MLLARASLAPLEAAVLCTTSDVKDKLSFTFAYYNPSGFKTDGVMVGM